MTIRFRVFIAMLFANDQLRSVSDNHMFGKVQKSSRHTDKHTHTTFLLRLSQENGWKDSTFVAHHKDSEYIVAPVNGV